MRRREFVSLLGFATTWPMSVRAQQARKIWRIGFIAHRYEGFYDALFEGLRELGYVEGENIAYERRYAEGRAERFEEFAREMVELKADVIVVVTTPAAQAAMKETATIPIVHPAIVDPLGTGILSAVWPTQAGTLQAVPVSSLNLPGSAWNCSSRWSHGFLGLLWFGIPVMQETSRRIGKHSFQQTPLM